MPDDIVNARKAVMSSGFSVKLIALSKSSRQHNIGYLIGAFEDKSFAALFIILMALSALPIPTGGVTNIFEIITMILAVQMIAGRQSMWLPKRLSQRKLSLQFFSKTLPVIMKWVDKLERLSHPRLANIVNADWFQRLNGLVILVFALFAFIAPPFTNLETLPALGIIIMALALLLDDLVFSIVGFLVGCTGIALIFILGSLAFKLI